MTCTSADEACPHVPGAAVRVALPYVDPKASDGTPDEAAAYDRCCEQVAREMLYLTAALAAAS
jgi:arsenate reductase